jgi:hypothetical protein
LARIRTIKPDFYLDDELAELSLAARFVFPGLWQQADRRGRLRYSPRKLKAQIIPYDNLSMDELVSELAAGGFVVRYSVNGCEYLHIPAFEKHQHCHVREPESVLPAPCAPDASPVPAPNKPGASTPASTSGVQEGKGREGVGASPVPAPCSSGGIATRVRCPACHGKGKVKDSITFEYYDCRACKGEGTKPGDGE